MPENFTISEAVRTWAKTKSFDRLDEHLEAFRDRALAKGYEYLDWDRAFRNAIREDWGKIRTSTNGQAQHESLLERVERKEREAAEPVNNTAIEHWWETEDSIVAKGREIRLPRADGEHAMVYCERILNEIKRRALVVKS